MAKKSYNVTCLVNSCHYDITSIEHYIGQSTIAFIYMYDVTYVYGRVNECYSWVYEPRWSKTGSSQEIVGEC